MGFTIDMISGEIQDYSSSTKAKDRKEINENASMEDCSIYQPEPRIQEYVPLDNMSNIIPDSLVNVDIDVFIDQM